MTGQIQSQLVGLAATLVAGIIAGTMFDLYRVVRWALRPGKLLTAISDIVFWLFITIMVFKFILAYSWGEVRFYMLVGFAMGFGVYRVVIGRRIVGGAVSTYEYAQYVRKRTVYGFREGIFKLRRASSKWRRRLIKACTYLGTVWENIKKILCFHRKES